MAEQGFLSDSPGYRLTLAKEVAGAGQHDLNVRLQTMDMSDAEALRSQHWQLAAYQEMEEATAKAAARQAVVMPVADLLRRLGRVAGGAGALSGDPWRCDAVKAVSRGGVARGCWRRCRCWMNYLMKAVLSPLT